MKEVSFDHAKNTHCKNVGKSLLKINIDYMQNILNSMVNFLEKILIMKRTMFCSICDKNQ